MVTIDNEKVVIAIVIGSRAMTFLTFLNMLSAITTFVVKMSGNKIPKCKKCHYSMYNNKYQNDKNVNVQKCQRSKMSQNGRIIHFLINNNCDNRCKRTPIIIIIHKIKTYFYFDSIRHRLTRGQHKING